MATLQEPRKILQITPYYWPRIGGVEKHVQAISELLAAQGQQVTVITEQFDRTLPGEEIHNQVRILRFPTVSKSKRGQGIKKLLYKLSVFKQMFFYLRLMQQSDKIQMHDVAWWLLPLWPFFARKLYITFHGWEGIFPVPFKNKFQRQLFSSWAKGVIHVGAWIETFYGDQPNTVVYGGVIPPQPLVIKANEFGMKHAPYTFVFVGRLEKENEIPKYLELIKNLTTATFKPRVLWVGDGKYRHHCAKVGKVVGFKPDIAEYIQRGKIILASSYLAMLEAQSYGKIVAAFYSHPLKQAYLETYPGSKYAVLAGSVEQMKQKLQPYLVDSWENVSKKRNQIKNFAESQTWQQVVNEYLWLWQK